MCHSIKVIKKISTRLIHWLQLIHHSISSLNIKLKRAYTDLLLFLNIHVGLHNYEIVNSSAVKMIISAFPLTHNTNPPPLPPPPPPPRTRRFRNVISPDWQVWFEQTGQLLWFGTLCQRHRSPVIPHGVIRHFITHRTIQWLLSFASLSRRQNLIGFVDKNIQYHFYYPDSKYRTTKKTSVTLHTTHRRGVKRYINGIFFAKSWMLVDFQVSYHIIAVFADFLF